MDERRPMAFLSYAHFADNFDDGYLTQFCLRLSGEVCLQKGDDFPIFQDRKDISWGDCWKVRINGALDTTTFLIPVITPGFFKSEHCREELSRFLEIERKLRRDDLILPIYYVDTPVLNDKKLQVNDELAQIISSRQYADWRTLRFEDILSRDARKEISNLAAQICKALSRLDNIKKTTENDLNPSNRSSIESIGEGQEAISPKTIVVDQMHPGEIATIAQAIAVAAPGDKIIVRPGLYEEGIVIDKPLEIVGEGERDHTKIRAKGMHTITFKAAAGRVANLSLIQIEGDEFCCVDISRGMMILEECDLTCKGNYCISIHDFADPLLRRNTIHNNKNGVIVTENGQGSLEDNDIFENSDADVEISKGGNPSLKRNRIHDGKGDSIQVLDNGQGILEGNDIFGHDSPQVVIQTGGNPTLRRNRIHDGKSNGVIVSDSGLGILEDNEIFGHELPQVVIITGGNPTLRRNRIHDGKTNGIRVSDNGLGTLEDNEIFGHELPQIAIDTGSNPTLRRNRIHDGKGIGIYIFNNGQGIFEENDLRGNKKGAWDISKDSKSNVKLIRNLE